MSRTLCLLLTSLILLLAAAPAAAAEQAEPMQVFVSVIPQQTFVAAVGGEHVAVQALVPPGASPATYEPSPRQMAALAKAKLYFATGVPFEQAWLPRIRAANPDLEIVDITALIKLQPMVAHHHDDDDDEHHKGEHEEHGEDHGHEHEGLLDPHVWLSPPLVRIMTETIRHELAEKDPVHAADYRDNGLAFAAQVSELDAELCATFAGMGERRAFMVYHPAFGYLASAYGLQQVPIESEGKEPGPRELAEIQAHAKELGIAAVVVEPQFSRRSAEVLAGQIGAQVIVLDPLAADWAENLRHMAQALKDAAR